MRIGIIGAGYWGQKVIRNLQKINDVDIRIICDLNPEVLKQYACKVTTNTSDVFSEELDVIFILTRAHTHYDLAKKSLEKGCHVFVEKPMTLTYSHAEELVMLAEKQGKVLFVDHTFLHSWEINFFYNYICEGDNIKFVETTRYNWGPFSKDINVIWDLAPHDFSILNYIIPYKPYRITTVGLSVFNVIEKATIKVDYLNTNLHALINVSWLEREKSRNIKIIDEDSEACFDSAKKQNLIITSHIWGDAICGYQPDLSIEPLLKELQYFISCVRTNSKPTVCSGKSGAEVVKLLEAADLSLKIGSHVYV